MKTNHTMLVAAALWLTAAAVSLAASVQMGTWKLNESKSHLSTKARNYTVIYTAAKGDMTKVEAKGVDQEGKPVDWNWVGHFDGKFYKMKNNAIADMAAYKPVNDRTNEITMTKNGKEVVMTTVAVAKDGKSRMVTSTVTDPKGKKHTDKAYYDKQ